MSTRTGRISCVSEKVWSKQPVRVSENWKEMREKETIRKCCIVSYVTETILALFLRSKFV